MVTIPPTTLYTPKSSAPIAFKTTRTVNKLTSNIRNIRMYKKTVFLAIRTGLESGLFTMLSLRNAAKKNVKQRKELTGGSQ